METLQAKLDAQAAATKTAEANAKAAEEKAAQQATVAAAARAEVHACTAPAAAFLFVCSIHALATGSGKAVNNTVLF